MTYNNMAIVRNFNFVFSFTAMTNGLLELSVSNFVLYSYKVYKYIIQEPRITNMTVRNFDVIRKTFNVRENL